MLLPPARLRQQHPRSCGDLGTRHGHSRLHRGHRRPGDGVRGVDRV